MRRVRARRHGMIEVAAGRLVRVRAATVDAAGDAAGDRDAGPLEAPLASRRLLPGLLHSAEGHAELLGGDVRCFWPGDDADQHPGASVILDEIAQLRRADALVCDLGNARISDRLLTRWGWTSLNPGQRRRLFIKRFYGHYPSPDPLLHALCTPRGASTDGASAAEPAASDESETRTHTCPSRSLTG